MSAAKDARKLTPLLAAGMTYVDVVVAGTLVRALYDTGSNCTIVSESLARALNLSATPFTRSFTLANGSRGSFVGKLPSLEIQLHDSLALEVEGVRVMEQGNGGM